MLILSRRCGEAIIVDENVRLTILSVKGRQVRIGIEAPSEVSVHREEIYKRIQAGEQVGYKGEEAAADAADGRDEQPQPQKQDTVGKPAVEAAESSNSATVISLETESSG